MPVTFHQEDILPHIGGPDTLAGKTALNESCISLLGVLKVCARISQNSIIVTVYLAGVEIGSATINPSNPCIKIGGGAAGFKAEVEVCMNFDTLVLKICGKVCAPIVGCKQGCTSVHL